MQLCLIDETFHVTKIKGYHRKVMYETLAETCTWGKFDQVSHEKVPAKF